MYVFFCLTVSTARQSDATQSSQEIVNFMLLSRELTYPNEQSLALGRVAETVFEAKKFRIPLAKENGKVCKVLVKVHKVLALGHKGLGVGARRESDVEGPPWASKATRV